jgi:hypothetical protein
MGWRGSMNMWMDDSADAGPSGALIGPTRADCVLWAGSIAANQDRFCLRRKAMSAVTISDVSQLAPGATSSIGDMRSSSGDQVVHGDVAYAIVRRRTLRSTSTAKQVPAVVSGQIEIPRYHRPRYPHPHRRPPELSSRSGIRAVRRGWPPVASPHSTR